MEHAESAADLNARALKWIAVITLVAVPLLATHEGEFWPFSIYPMFSQAGRPWERMMVRDVDVDRDTANAGTLWETRELETLLGRPLALDPLGIPQNDFTKLVKTTKRWTADRLEVLRGMFVGPLGEGRQLLVYRIGGTVTDDGRASTWAKPVLLLKPDGATEFHPDLEGVVP